MQHLNPHQCENHMHLVHRNVKGDGHCLFRALSVLLFNDEEKFNLVKEIMLSFMRNAREDFRSNVFNPFQWNRVKEILAADGSVPAPYELWGNEYAIWVACDVFHLRIHVLQSGKRSMMHLPSRNAETATIVHLQFENSHFTPLTATWGELVVPKSVDADIGFAFVSATGLTPTEAKLWFFMRRTLEELKDFWTFSTGKALKVNEWILVTPKKNRSKSVEPILLDTPLSPAGKENVASTYDINFPALPSPRMLGIPKLATKKSSMNLIDLSTPVKSTPILIPPSNCAAQKSNVECVDLTTPIKSATVFFPPSNGTSQNLSKTGYRQFRNRDLDEIVSTLPQSLHTALRAATRVSRTEFHLRTPIHLFGDKKTRKSSIVVDEDGQKLKVKGKSVQKIFLHDSPVPYPISEEAGILHLFVDLSNGSKFPNPSAWKSDVQQTFRDGPVTTKKMSTLLGVPINVTRSYCKGVFYCVKKPPEFDRIVSDGSAGSTFNQNASVVRGKEEVIDFLHSVFQKTWKCKFTATDQFGINYTCDGTHVLKRSRDDKRFIGCSKFSTVEFGHIYHYVPDYLRARGFLSTLSKMLDHLTNFRATSSVAARLELLRAFVDTKEEAAYCSAVYATIIKVRVQKSYKTILQGG